MKKRFESLCKVNIKREGIYDLLDWLDSTDFYEAPASTKHHNAFKSGLLQHSLEVYDQFERITKSYPEIHISKETQTIITLFHDFCKINYYKFFSDLILKDEQFPLTGHGSKSVILILRHMKLTDEEIAAIDAHMGAWDSNKVGTIYTKYPVAWLLHVADEAATYLVEK